MRRSIDDGMTLDGVIDVYADMVRNALAYVRLVEGNIIDFPIAEICRLHMDGSKFVLTWPVARQVRGKSEIFFRSAYIPDEIIDCDRSGLMQVLKRSKEIKRGRQWDDWSDAFAEEVAGIASKADLITIREPKTKTRKVSRIFRKVVVEHRGRMICPA